MHQLAKEALADKLAGHLKAPKGESYLMECTEEALALVEAHIGEAKVPAVMKERAIIECATELYWRRNNRNGIAQFDTDGGLELMRVSADPMHAARIILRPWLGVAIA